MLLFPVVVPMVLAYGIVSLPVYFVLDLLHLLGRFLRKPPEHPLTKFSLPELRERARSLSQWFGEMLEDPDAADCLGVGPDLAKELLRLTHQPGLTQGEAKLFAERVQRDLQGYKGIPFFELGSLSRQLAESFDNEKAA